MATTTVYHGTTIEAIPGLLTGKGRGEWGWLSVTDTFGRATRYANARATSVAHPEYNQRVARFAAVLTLEVDEPLHWMRRDGQHGTLDDAEALPRTWRVVGITYGAVEPNTVCPVRGREREGLIPVARILAEAATAIGAAAIVCEEGGASYRQPAVVVRETRLGVA